MNATPVLRCFGLLAAALTLTLTACGGGGGDKSAVTNMSAGNARYGNTATITISGRNLLQAAVTIEVDGPCVSPTRSGAGSDDTQQFTCGINGVGPLTVRALDADGGTLARLSLEVPLPQVTVTTSQGSFVLELDPVSAPLAVQNFLGYLNAGFYRTTIIHRALADNLIQGGAYATGTVFKAPTAEAVNLTPNNGLKNLRGSIAAVTDLLPNSMRAQWFINLRDNPANDYVDANNPGNVVFGKVISGLDTIDKIGALPTRPDLAAQLTHVPVPEVVITATTQTR
jgi:peptidyl-prolyl cis-trans isomerase A (cyclophilin A)